MSPLRRVGFVVLVALAVVAATWCALTIRDSLREGGVRPRDEHASPSAAPADAAASPGAAEPTRDLETPPSLPDDDLTTQEPGTDEERELVLSGRVIDVAAAPVVGAKIEAFLPSAREFNVLDLDYNREVAKLGSTRSDARGRFALRLERGRVVHLRASAEKLASRWVPDQCAGSHVEIVLDAGCTLRGRVTRKEDGSPIAGAAVRVFRLGGPSIVSYRATTDANGEYRFDGLPSEGTALEILPQVEQGAPWMDLVFGPDRTLVKDVVVERGTVVKGRVTDATSGAPIEGAFVGEGWTYRRFARTNADGSYELPGFGSSGVSDVHVRAPGYSRQMREHPPTAVAGVLALDFALVAARSATGRVVDAAGAPIAGVYVAAVAGTSTSEGQIYEWPSDRTAEDGRFEIRDLHSSVRHALFVRKGGLATVVYEFPLSEISVDVVELGDVTLLPAATLLGRVVDEDGAGVSGVRLSLEGSNDDRFRWIEAESPTEPVAGFYVGTRSTRSADDGRFAYSDLPAGTFQLNAAASGRPPTPDLEVTIAQGEVRRGVEIRMAAGAKIAGLVVSSVGVPVAGIEVFAMPHKSGAPGAQSRTGADGSFEIRGLVAGDYRLQVQYFRFGEASERDRLLPVFLESVEAGRDDLRIEMPIGESIRGVVRDEAGAAVADAWVHASDAQELGVTKRPTWER